jgi:transketolase
LHFHTLKPFDEAALVRAARGVRLVVSVEEHTRIGGLGSAVAEVMAEEGIRASLLRLGFPDVFSRDYGNQDHVLAMAGLRVEDLCEQVRTRLRVSVAV